MPWRRGGSVPGSSAGWLFVAGWLGGGGFLRSYLYVRAEVLAEESVPPPAKSWRFWGAKPEPEAERPPPLSPFSALRAARERELEPLDPDA